MLIENCGKLLNETKNMLGEGPIPSSSKKDTIFQILGALRARAAPTLPPAFANNSHDFEPTRASGPASRDFKTNIPFPWRRLGPAALQGSMGGKNSSSDCEQTHPQPIPGNNLPAMFELENALGFRRGVFDHAQDFGAV